MAFYSDIRREFMKILGAFFFVSCGGSFGSSPRTYIDTNTTVDCGGIFFEDNNKFSVDKFIGAEECIH